MAYETIPSRTEGYNSYATQDLPRKNYQSPVGIYHTKDITDTITPQQVQGQKYLISRLPRFEYKNNDEKPAFKFGTLALADYMGGKRTYPTSLQPSRLKNMRNSYSKN